MAAVKDGQNGQCGPSLRQMGRATMLSALDVDTTREELEACRAKQFAVLVHGALACLAEVEEHHHVQHGDAGIRFAGHSEHLDDEQALRRRDPAGRNDRLAVGLLLTLIRSLV